MKCRIEINSRIRHWARWKRIEMRWKCILIKIGWFSLGEQKTANWHQQRIEYSGGGKHIDLCFAVRLRLNGSLRVQVTSQSGTRGTDNNSGSSSNNENRRYLRAYVWLHNFVSTPRIAVAFSQIESKLNTKQRARSRIRFDLFFFFIFFHAVEFESSWTGHRRWWLNVESARGSQ